MSGHLQAIIDLQHTLNELAEAETRLAGIPDWMQELHDEHSQQQAEIDAVVAAGEEAASARRKAEADLADAQERLSHFQSQIGRVATQREYGAILKEIDTAKEQISDLEKLVMTSIESADEAAKKLEEMREAFRELDERYKTELTKWESEKPQVADAIETYQSKATALREILPPPLERLFDRVHEWHRGDAIAAIHQMTIGGGKRKTGSRGWHCGACNFRVRPQVAVEIRNQGSVIQCEGCKRIFYFQDEEEEEA